jgi:uncharacterized protein
MLITKMRSRECRELVTRLGFGRLACVSNNRPYIVPIYFSYDADCLYCFSTLGRKIEWMRENPLVCVEVDEIVAHDNWVSVLLSDTTWSFPTLTRTRKAASTCAR